MIRYMAAHPTAANLLMLVLIVAGLIKLPSLNRETFPRINSYEVQVSVVYRGAAPSDVELGICRPLEDATDGLSFLEEKRCESRSGMGIMTLKMLENGDFDQFKEDINTAVDGIDSFPVDSEKPVIEELGRTEQVVTLAITADMPRPQLKDLAEDLKQKFLQTGTTATVEIQGFSQREFQVRIPSYNLRRYGLSLTDISRRLSEQNIDLPAGNITNSKREYQIRLNDERRTREDLASLIIIYGEQHAELRLGDIAEITDGFADVENTVTYDGTPAAFLVISKNVGSDSLRLLEEVEQFVAKEQQLLPDAVKFQLTQDYTSIVKDRLNLLISNAWQGLILVFAVMWLFFGTRYAGWVTMGLPVSFMASAFLLSFFGITINMISMVALLLALGILMDDAIVISESIGSQMRKGKSPLEAAVDGTQLVARGVFASFLTTLVVFSGLLVMQGQIGQILVVIPIVLISVISVSLIEAFFILPHHLYHSLEHQKSKPESAFRVRFEENFDRLRQRLDKTVQTLLRYRYGFIGVVIAAFILSIGMMVNGIVKFSAFPSIEGDVLQARLIMPTGTSFETLQATVDEVIAALETVEKPFDEKQKDKAIEHISVLYGQNADAYETGPHVATISIDVLTAEKRNFSIKDLQSQWQNATSHLDQLWYLVITEPQIGPAGRPIEIRLAGVEIDDLNAASHSLSQWLAGYPGVSNLMTDLRPGMPEFTLHFKEGAYSLGLNAENVANQLRAAYQGAKASESNIGLENYDIMVQLDDASRGDLAGFYSFPIIHPQTAAQIPLSVIADIETTRGLSRIQRVNNQRVVTITGDVDRQKNNVEAILNDVKTRFLPELKKNYPGIQVVFKGELEEGAKTAGSMQTAMMIALIGIFVLLSFQFKSYSEPLIVMINIPLALIGVIWGHLLMGLELTMPSMMGFVSLAGVVVNDSILLVETAKRHMGEGLPIEKAAARASHDRFRAVLLTSLTTIAGMTPLLFETSLQAQILIPLATAIVFGIASSTLLILFVVPCLYTIIDDAQRFYKARKTPTASDTRP